MTEDDPKPTCSAAGCDRAKVARGLCHGHYKRLQTKGAIGGPIRGYRHPIKTCSVPGCERLARSAGADYCEAHYARQRATGSVGPAEIRPRRSPKPPGPCEVSGCNRERQALGLCATHYRRLRVHGDVDTTLNPIGASLRERFEMKLPPADERDPTACWPWQGAVDRRSGYGEITVQGERRKRLRAHRVAHELYKGPIPGGLTIDHLCHSYDQHCPGGRCEHRRCVNPAHLEAVSRAENSLRGQGSGAKNARKTHCKHGHLLSGENLRTWTSDDGLVRRECKACRKKYHQRSERKRYASDATRYRP